MFKTILLATDGSGLSDQAVQAAIDFAQRNGSRIVGISVVENYASLPMTVLSGGIGVGLVQDVLEAQARDSVKRVADLAAKAGVACETHTVSGVNPDEGILRNAADHGCDLIFMASNGRTGLDKMMLGSVAQKVVTKSSIPVVIFKQTADAAKNCAKNLAADDAAGTALSIAATAYIA